MKKMLLMISRIWVLMLGVLLASCASSRFWADREQLSPQEISIEILKPALHRIAPGYRTLGIANTSLNANLAKLSRSETDRKVYERFLIDSIGANFLIDRLTENLSASPRFDSVHTLDASLFDRASSGLNELPAWCNEHDVDLVFVVNSFSVSYNYEAVKSSDMYVQSYTTRVPYIVLSYTYITVKIGWQLLDPVQNKILLSNQIDKTVIREDKKHHKISQIVSFEQKLKALETTCGHFGAELALEVAPIWVSTRRGYFVSGHDDMLAASAYVQHNAWTDAVPLWQKHRESNNSALARRALFNLALAAEIDDRPADALVLANEAWTKYRLAEAKLYAKTLERRVEEKRALEEQLNANMTGD